MRKKSMLFTTRKPFSVIRIQYSLRRHRIAHFSILIILDNTFLIQQSISWLTSHNSRKARQKCAKWSRNCMFDWQKLYEGNVMSWSNCIMSFPSFTSVMTFQNHPPLDSSDNEICLLIPVASMNRINAENTRYKPEITYPPYKHRLWWMKWNRFTKSCCSGTVNFYGHACTHL